MNVVVLTAELRGASSGEMLVDLLRSKDCVLGVSSDQKKMQLFGTTAYYAIRNRIAGTADEKKCLSNTFVIDGHYSCYGFLGINSNIIWEDVQRSYEKIIDAWEKEGKPDRFEFEGS